MYVWPLRASVHDNPFNTCQDISLKSTNVSLMVEQEENSGDHQNL